MIGRHLSRTKPLHRSMGRLSCVVIPALVGIAGAAVAQGPAVPMSVERYLARQASIEARLKALQPDLQAMTRVTEQAITAYRAENEAAEAAGRTPRGCLPLRGSQNRLSGNEVLAAMREVPRGERAMPVQEALFAFFDRRYPCVSAGPAPVSGPPSR